MIVQVLLTIGLAGCLIYGFLERRRSTVASRAIALVSGIGCFFVWFPSSTSTIAGLLGVGRGTDLILYCWVTISLFLALNIHLKLNAQQQALTDLARWIALSTPRLPR
jgi:hypothetical protein